MFDHVIIDCLAVRHRTRSGGTGRHRPPRAHLHTRCCERQEHGDLPGTAGLSLASPAASTWIVNRAGERNGISATDIAEALDHPGSRARSRTPSTCRVTTNSARLLSVSHPQHAISMAIRGYATYINPPPAGRHRQRPSPLSKLPTSGADYSVGGWRRHEPCRAVEGIPGARVERQPRHLPDPRTGNDSMVNPTGPPPDNYAEVRQEARVCCEESRHPDWPTPA